MRINFAIVVRRQESWLLQEHIKRHDLPPIRGIV